MDPPPCTCLYPHRTYDTASGHAPDCPVEKQKASSEGPSTMNWEDDEGEEEARGPWMLGWALFLLLVVGVAVALRLLVFRG